MSRRVVVTAGPSIAAADVRALLPGSEVVAPVRFGDTYRFGLVRGDALVVVDGLFWQTASVRHRELLDLIHAGVEVYGCSSMGALRAAELTAYGMVGHGQVFESYRHGDVVGDDEVGMVHAGAEHGFTVGVDALVNVRATVAAAVAAGRIEPEEAHGMLAAARRRCFTDRSWAPLLDAAGVAATRRRSFLGWASRRPVDVKRDDAVSLLEMLASGATREAIAAAGPNPAMPLAPPGPSGFTSAWTHRLAPRSDTPDVSDGDLLTMAAVTGEDHPSWWHRQMLRVLAATQLRVGAASDTADRGTSRPRGVSEAAWCSWRRRESVLTAAAVSATGDLERLAVGRLVASGVLASSTGTLPAAVEGEWVFGDERDRPVGSRSALVATRSALADRHTLLDRSLLVDLAESGAVPSLAAEVTRVRAEFAHRYPTYTGALSPKGRRVVEDRLAVRWGAPVPQELRRRGLRELPELGVMVALLE